MVSNEEIEKIIKKALKTLRKSQACILAVEEISELITEITNFIAGQGSSTDIAEEFADVNIMVNLVMGTFGIKPKDIVEAKKKHKKNFDEYSSSFTTKKRHMQALLWELANLQKAISKASRKKKNKKNLILAITGVELYFDYMQNNKWSILKDYEKWYQIKIMRMKKRARKHNIV